MRGVLVGCVAVMVGCEAPALPEPPLQLGPCVPERVQHVEGFGYYDSADYLDETAQYTTLAWGWPHSAAHAHAAGKRMVVDLNGVFQISSARGLDADVELAWRAVADQLRPLRASIAALYTADEPYWYGSKAGIAFDEIARRLEHAEAVIHATEGFEDVPLAVIFADPTLEWLSSGAARNPRGYAWVGFDLYAEPPAQLEQRAALFRSLVRPEQRIIVVPDAMIFAHKEQDVAALEERIAFWLAWTERHPEVVVIAPFIYRSLNTPAVSWTGARDLPPIRDRYAEIGQCIQQAAVLRSARAAAPTP